MFLKKTDYFRIREQQFSYQGPHRFKAKFDQNALVRIAALFSGIYAAPFPNAFIISRCQRLAFSPVFVLLLSPRSSGSSRSASLSLPFSFSFFLSLSSRLLPNSQPFYFTRHAQTLTLALVRLLLASLLSPLTSLSLSYVLLFF